MFNVTLTKIDTAQKAKAIREVKAIMPSMNLVEVSRLVSGRVRACQLGRDGETGMGGAEGSNGGRRWTWRANGWFYLPRPRSLWRVCRRCSRCVSSPRALPRWA